jgi:hypothetical protein
MGSNREPDFVEIVEMMISSSRRSMFGGWLPGRIATYDATKCKASIQILLLETKENEGAAPTKQPVAIINEVPVMTFSDHHGIRVELALQKGDTVMVCFAARSIDRWKQRGGMIDPGDDRDHDLNDAVAIPMLFDFAHVTKPTAKVKFTATEVQAGGTSALAKSDALSAITTALDAASLAIAFGNPTGAAALDAFKTALEAIPGWPHVTTVLKGG